MTAKLTAMVTIEVQASRQIAEAHAAMTEAGGNKYVEPVKVPGWQADADAKLAGAISDMRAAMKGWRQSRTDVGMFWCCLRGPCHQFQTYWEKA